MSDADWKPISSCPEGVLVETCIEHQQLSEPMVLRADHFSFPGGRISVNWIPRSWRPIPGAREGIRLHPIVKLEKHGVARYMAWSLHVQMPVTRGMAAPEFEAYHRAEYGLAGMRDFRERLARAQQTGTSWVFYDSGQRHVDRNRAGPNRSRLTLDEIWEQYVGGGRP